MNDSSTGGPLLPVAGALAPLEDDALDQFVQQIVAQVSGLDGQWVRPRWQQEPPNIPPDDQNWAAVGITGFDGDSYPFPYHVSAGDGSDQLIRYEQIEMLASFYGPHSSNYCRTLRDGLYIAQNREALFLAGMGLVNCGQLLVVPTLLKQKWLKRVDLSILLRRSIQRTYPVLNLTSASGTLITETVTDPFTVEE